MPNHDEKPNQVAIDEQARQDELDQIGRDADADTRTAEREVAAQVAEETGSGWQDVCHSGAEFVAAHLVPNWQLSEKETADFSAALADLFNRWMPGGFEGIDDWHPLTRLAFVSVMIALPRFDWQAGKFKSPRVIKDADSEAGGRDPDSDNGGEPVGKDRVGFATVGE